MGKPTISTNEPLRIAPSRCRNRKHWTVEDWANLDFAAEEDWQRAIDIFEDRIRHRFLDVVETIQCMSFSGFSVMALDCLLIETLQQFYEGVDETPRGESREYFQDFLTRTEFGQFFDQGIAEEFYHSIRCGILHQAEVKGDSKIWIRDGSPLVKWASDRNGLIINRNLFHRKLERVFEKYLEDLRRSNHSDTDLRDNFKRKMDFVCRARGSEVE